MRPLLAPLVALLLVVPLAVPATGSVAAPTAPAQAADGESLPQITVVDNTTNHLSIPDSEVRVATYNRTSIDVGVAVAAGSRELRSRYAVSKFEQEFFRRDTDAARDQLVADTLADIETRVERLERQQESATQRYASGALTTQEFLRQRALVDTESRQLTRRLERVRTAAGTAPDYSLSQAQRFRLENNRGVLKTFRGPISRQVATEATGEADATTVYLEASSTGYMLSTVTDGQYTRETYLGSERRPESPDQFADTPDPLGAVNSRAEGLYPWLYSEQYPAVQTYGRTAIYQLQADHPNGQLTAFLDGGTANVFYEYQSIELSTVERSTVATAVDQSTRLQVSQSYESGPLLIAVSDNATAAPIEGTVAINGQRVGTTGTDGALWSIEPQDDYTVTVTTQDGERISVRVENGR
ncbi:DUF7096 domain-containing protein [Haloarcula salina]|uniref:Uncharacterized protein n=1 Tax=Haloarcula salina TaxID=1429914 RepID=A0AA41FYM7_9EURY|nr:hypothetical protein [Haloarcula salina]MBV0900329.1 hypothetical protein [Haloarcula salina]